MKTVSLIRNKKAFFDYEITDKYEAGVELFGFEVKSVKGSQGSLEGGQVIIRGGEAYLVGARIPAYQPKNTPKDYDPERTRKLLLTKREIERLATETSSRNLTIVPISMYSKGTKLKLE